MLYLSRGRDDELNVKKSVLVIMFIMLMLCTVTGQYMITGAAVVLLSPSTS
jgi:hypothetical protein